MREFTARDRLKLLGGGGLSALLSGCGGGKNAPAQTPLPDPASQLRAPYVFAQPMPGQLRNAWAGSFGIGAATEMVLLNDDRKTRKRMETQFNSVTPEYTLKPSIIAPVEGQYDFSQADALWDFAAANNMTMRGHALLWHEATPDWMLTGSRAEIRAKLETYVTDVVTHFAGRIMDWDVVNEVISDIDQGGFPYRDTPWLQAIGGPEYIDWAFNAARAADPSARLFISDYSTELPGKRGRLIAALQDIAGAGVQVDGVAHQMHLRLSSYIPDALDTIDAIDNLNAGLVNQVTELDITVYDDPGSCYVSGTNCPADVGNPMPPSMARRQADMVREFLTGLAQRPSVDNVTFWGIRDDQSWLNFNPALRFNHPLLFDHNGDPKLAFYAVADPDFDW